MDQSNANHPFKEGPAQEEPLREEPLGEGPRREYPPWVASDEIRAMRKRLGLTQRDFATCFGFAAATLRHWERGNRVPTGPALVLLTVINDNPRVVIQAVRKARLRAPGSLPAVEHAKSHRAPPGFGERPPPLRSRGPRRPG